MNKIKPKDFVYFHLSWGLQISDFSKKTLYYFLIILYYYYYCNNNILPCNCLADFPVNKLQTKFASVRGVRNRTS